MEKYEKNILIADKDKETIKFSVVWEDYITVQKGLQIHPGARVLSICSAGDNVFNLLHENPREVVAVDLSSQQIALAQLKAGVLKKATKEEIVPLFEGTLSKKETEKILGNLTFELGIKKELETYNLLRGLDNIGAFDVSIVPILRFFLRRIFNEDVFLSYIPTKQNAAFEKRFWVQSLLWLLSRKSVYKKMVVGSGYENFNVGMYSMLYNNWKNFCARNDFSMNPYIQKVWYGHYHTLPVFLKNIQQTQDRLGRVSFVHSDIFSFLKSQPDNSFDAINLSDILDWCSDELYTKTISEISRVLIPGGRVLSRELFLTRVLPNNCALSFLEEESLELHRVDGTPFYTRTLLLKKNN